MKIALKYIIAFGIMGLFSFTSNAQEKQKQIKISKHEISVYGGGGLSTLLYSTNFGDHTNKMGGLFGVGYTYFFTENIGLVTGLEMASHNAKSTMGKNVTDAYITKDINGEDFGFTSVINNHNETQNTMFFNIPVMVQYQDNKKHGFYGALGVKIGIPIYKKYKISRANYFNTGSYSNPEEIFDDNNFMGFGEFNGRSTRKDLDIKMTFTLAAEAGVKWTLTKKLNLYSGAYIDYGLNNINKSAGEKYLAEYNIESPRDFGGNSMLHSKYPNKHTDKIINKVNLFSVGLKIRLSFNL